MGYGISLTGTQPWISILSPNWVRPGSEGTTILINGYDFEPGAKVLWRGQLRPANFLSDQTMSLDLSAADLAAEGIFSVEIQNPGSIPSNTHYFEVSRSCFRCPRVVSR